MHVHLVDGTYELYRQHYGQASKHSQPPPFAGTIGVLTSTIQLLQDGATHIMGHAEHGYTANLPFDDATRDESLVVWEFDNEPIEPIHGGPVRLLVPNLYFWKSPKWLRGIEVMNSDKPGFWERNGYHMYGDPFLEQRHWGD